MTDPRWDEHKTVFVGSPFSGDTKKHVAYAKRCLVDSLSRGEYPFLPHLIYPLVLINDDLGYTRYMGTLAADAWLANSSRVIMYCDLGISKGMRDEITKASTLGITVEFRYLDEKK